MILFYQPKSFILAFVFEMSFTLVYTWVLPYAYMCVEESINYAVNVKEKSVK